MTYHTKTLGLASVGALAIGAAVSLTPMTAEAATLTLEDASDGTGRTMPTNHSLGTGGTGGNSALGWSLVGYNALVPSSTGRVGDNVTSFHGTQKDGDNGISVSGKSRVTFTYLGSEAGHTNLAVELVNNNVVFRNKADGSDPATSFAETFTMRFGPGLIPFSYETDGDGGGDIANNGGQNGTDVEIAYGAIFNMGKSVNVFFGDGAGDSDLDDLGMRIDVTSVPLPASALLLLGGLGGLGGLSALRRRKRTA